LTFAPSSTARAAQLEELTSAWQVARRGKTRLVFLEGEAGIGKSWLVRALTARLEAERASVLTVAAPGALGNLLRAAKPWLEGERAPGFLAAARRVLPQESWTLVSGDAGEVNPNVEVVRAVERAVARLGGACLIVEDAHWATPDDLDMLRLLYRRLAQTRSSALLVVTARPGSGLLERLESDASLADAAPPAHLRLECLDAHGVTLLARDVLHSADVPEGLSVWLHARSEGHPLHAQELLRFLVAGGFVRDLGASHGFTPPPAGALPRNLEAVLEARLHVARQERDLWTALAALAVLERAVDERDWAEAAGLSAERLGVIARRALSLGLAHAEASGGVLSYALTHPLYPPLVRGGLSETDLRARYAAALLSARDAGERARWARLSGHRQAAVWTREALEWTFETGAWAERLEHLEALLHLEPEADDRAGLEFMRGEALFRLGEYERALEALTPLESAEAVELACLVYARLGRDRAGLDYSARFLDRFEEDANFHIRFFWACFHARLGDPETSRAALEGLLGAARTPQQRVTALEGWDWYWKIHHPHAGLERLHHNLEGLKADRASGAPSDLSLANHHIFIAENYTALREFEQAQEAFARAGEHLARSGHRDTLMIYHLHVGQWALARGQSEAARGALLKSHTLAAQARDPIHTAHALLELSKTEFALGRTSQARTRLEAFEAAQAALDRRFDGGALLYHRDPDLEVAALRALLGLEWTVRAARLQSARGDDAIHAGLLLLLRGEPDAARAALERPTESGVREHPERALLLGAAALKTGDLETARAHFERARSLARTQRTEMLEGEAEIALGLCAAQGGDATVARRLGQGGLALLEMTRCPGNAVRWRTLFPDLAARALDLEPVNTSAPAKPARFIRTFGAFGLEEHGEVKPWKARKTRELLALLLCALVSEHGPGVARATLIDALWPESEPDRAESAFRVTLNRLRESLGDAARIERDASGRYALLESNSDLLLFLESSERRDLEGALAWYAGAFLPGMDLEAVDKLRADLRARWRGAVTQLVIESDLTRGATLLERLLEDDPLDFGVLERLIAHLKELGDDTRLRSTLERARQRVQHELGFSPPELERLARDAKIV
jgi:DNA-binding SARP family transcriptional activator